MKIAIVGTTASSMVGFRLSFLRTLVRNGHEVFALATGYTDKDRSVLEAEGVTPVDYCLNEVTARQAKSRILRHYYLFCYLRSISPDLYFGYFLIPSLIGSILAKWAGIPKIVCMIEGLGTAFTPHKGGLSKSKSFLVLLINALFKINSKVVHGFVVLNRDDYAHLNQVLGIKNVALLGGIGVDLKEYRFSPMVNKKRFIFVARLLKEKGIEEFLAAASVIKGSCQEAEFVVLGNIGSNSKRCVDIQLVKDADESGIVNFKGHVENVSDELKKASVFVLPSYYREGVPRSIQEAMAIGRCIITTDSVGCRDTVENGVSGLLVAPWSVDDLVAKMSYLLDNPSVVESMGKHSRDIAEAKFDADIVNKRLWGIVDGF